MKNYIGRKCKGFRFEHETDRVEWIKEKKKHIGEVGVIKKQSSRYVTIEFKDDHWDYPISLIEEHLIPEREANPPRFCEVHSEHCDMFCFDKNECALRNKVVVEGKTNDKQQELFDYLSNELGVEALLTQMQEIIKIASKQEDNSHGFCETPEEKCTMNYCDENGCQNRKRELVEETNPVDHPQHYGGGDNVYEAIKVIEAWDLGFNLGNTVKYIARCGKKDDELQELKKASWYLQREIAKLENAKSSK